MQNTIDEAFMVRGVVGPPAFRGRAGHLVGLAEAFRGACVVAATIENMAQRKQQAAAKTGRQVRILEPSLERYQVGVRELAARIVASRACGSA